MGSTMLTDVYEQAVEAASSYFCSLYFRAERSVKELKEKFLQGKTPDLVKQKLLLISLLCALCFH